MLLPPTYPSPQSLPSLREARPRNQIHLLFWDQPVASELQFLKTYNHAEIHHYSDRLLQRLTPQDKYLHLHHYLDREIEDLRILCESCTQSMILLLDIDLLLTYLRVQPESNMTTFWKNLELLTKLTVPLWLLLPFTLRPAKWPKERSLQIQSP